MATYQKPKTDIYETITLRIIEAIEAGKNPWKKTWNGAALASNYVTKNQYRGINALLTNLSPYNTPYFMTFKQIKQKKGSLKKGCKGVPIVYYIEKALDKEGKKISGQEWRALPKEKQGAFWLQPRYYTVFNIEDVEGIDFKLPELETQHSPIEAAEQVISNYATKTALTIEIKPGSNRCFYSPSADYVSMPSIKQFDTPEAYYMNMFHELTHSTGHKKRLNRAELTQMVAFGDKSYSKEELTAELGAAFVMTQLGLILPEHEMNSAAYLRGWLTPLKNDKKFLFNAATKARAACELILNA